MLSPASTSPHHSPTIIQPEPPSTQNPCACCNVKLGKVVTFSGIILIVLRSMILSFYMYCALNTPTFISVFMPPSSLLSSSHEFKPSSREQELRGISTLLSVQEIIFMITTYLLLIIGATKRKHDCLKSWLIFTAAHQAFALIAHAAIIYRERSFALSAHLPVSTPYLLLLFYLTHRLLREVKGEEEKLRASPILKKNKKWSKGKSLWSHPILITIPTDGPQQQQQQLY